MQNKTTDKLSKIADAVITVEDVRALWPVRAPSAERIFQWSRAGRFPMAHRIGSQKEPALFNKSDVVDWLERKFAPMIAKPKPDRRTPKPKGGRDA
jgi:hypothetical protein